MPKLNSLLSSLVASSTLIMLLVSFFIYVDERFIDCDELRTINHNILVVSESHFDMLEKDVALKIEKISHTMKNTQDEIKLLRKRIALGDRTDGRTLADLNEKLREREQELQLAQGVASSIERERKEVKALDDRCTFRG